MYAKTFSLVLIVVVGVAIARQENKNSEKILKDPSPLLMDTLGTNPGAIVEGVALFNKSHFENLKSTGHLSKDILKANPRLTYLGAYNNSRSFYIERTQNTQAGARSACNALGMLLYMPAHQLELNWLSAVTTGSDNYAWTDVRGFRNLQGFVFDQQCSGGVCSPLPNGYVETSWSDQIGMTFDRLDLPTNSKLRSTYTTTLRYYFCTYPM